MAGRWNIDNHSPSSIIFAGADDGTIRDRPVEIVGKKDPGLKETRFVVYWIDINKKCIGSPGVTFGYSIDTTLKHPTTCFLNAKSYDLSDEHKKLISGRSPWLK